MPKPIKKRIPKKMEVPEEEVREKLSSLRHTLQERQRTALKVGIAVVVAVIIALSFLVYYRTSATKAKQLEYEAYKIFYGGTALQHEQRAEQFKRALDMFKKAYGTKKSPISLYYIAACQYELGDYEESLKTLTEFARTYSGEDKFLPLIYRKMVTIHIKKNDLNEAKRTLDALYGLKVDVYKDYALYEYGRLLEKEGKLPDARKKYEELITRFPTSPYKEEVKAKLSVGKEG